MPLLLVIKNRAVSIVFFIILFLWLWFMMKNVIKSLVVIISLIIVFIFIIEIPKDVVIIEKISIPDNFKKDNIGFTEEVVANHIFDSIYKFQEAEGNEVLSDFVFQSTNGMPDIKIPTINFSLNSLFQYLKRSNFFRKIFNYKYIVIDGDIIANNTMPQDWIFTVRIIEGNHKFSKSIEWQGGNAIAESGEFLVKHFDMPLILKYYYDRKDYDKVIKIGLDIIEEFPVNYQALNLVGAAYSKTQNYEKAIYYLTKSLGLKPNNAISHYFLGNTLAKTNNTDEAIKHYEKAIKIKPDNFSAYKNLGKIYEKKGMNKEAIKYYKSSIRHIKKNNALIKVLEKKVETLRKKTD